VHSSITLHYCLPFEVLNSFAEMLLLASAASSILKYGVPRQSPDLRVYRNHALHYDQQRRVPRWVAELLTPEHVRGTLGRFIKIKNKNL
jgi:hypothetical protein